MPFYDRGVRVDKMFDWVVGEVKAVPDTVWWLNENFVVLGIKCVLSMLNGKGCQEMGRLRDLDGSHDATVVENVPKGVHKLAEQIVQRWWKPHGLPEALHRLEAAHAMTVSDSND
jgi:hypothetical protein